MVTLAPLACTGIGSVPFTEPSATAALILEQLPELPFWPQMVRLGYREDMLPQGAGGLPYLRIETENRTVGINPHVPRELALAHFYETVWAEDLSPFALQPEEAQGFFALLQAVLQRPEGPRAMKGQVVGPVTFTGMVKDAQEKPILYDRELVLAVSQGLAQKAAWQAQEFRRLGKQAVIFFDEPYLTGYGSAFLPVSREEVTTILADTLEATRQAGPVILGVHCCGNTDWSLLLEAPIDILSFDAYGYFDSLSLYGESLNKFLARGGWLAWGLVPTGEELHQEAVDSLWQRFQRQVWELETRGLKVPEVLSQSLLTPACGLGYLTPEAATRALMLLGELSARARQWLKET